MSRPLLTLRNTWDSPHSLVGQRDKVSATYVREYGIKSKSGKKNSYLRQGHEVLLKAVLQAMPTYTMNCFKIPKNLCRDIKALFRKFWWGCNGENMKIHWLAWNKLCKPKVEGGLGFRDIENFNLALLGKQVWRLIHNTDSLLYKVFKARYFPKCTIMDDEVNLNGSYAWQSILKARHVISMCATWRIGNGESVFIHGDRWLPDPHSNKVISPQKKISREHSGLCIAIRRWFTLVNREGYRGISSS